MSIEIPQHCADCPRVCALKYALAHSEQLEDALIQQYMMTDDLFNLGDSQAGLVAQNPEDGSFDGVTMPQLARVVIDAQLDEVKQYSNSVSKIIERATQACMGAVTLKSVQDGVAYEVTLCRSEEPADETEAPLNQGREGSLFEVALVKRESAETEQD